jgi:Aminotransferase class-III
MVCRTAADDEEDFGMPASSRTTAELLAARSQSVPRGVVTARPIVVSRAEGSHVWDTDGHRYLDFVGGIGVLNVGHNHPRVVAAVRRQLELVTHTAFQVAAYEPYITLAERLNALIGKGAVHKSLFLTTGAEAVENGDARLPIPTFTSGCDLTSMGFPTGQHCSRIIHDACSSLSGAPPAPRWLSAQSVFYDGY